MAFRKLEVVVHSAKDLDDVKLFGTMSPYATLGITTAGGEVSEIYKTDVAKKAGCYPMWNSRMVFKLDPTKNNDFVLLCLIEHDGTLFDRTIGQVEVPFTELLAGDGSSSRASYPVKVPYLGEVKGEIIISHKFLDPVVVSAKKGGSGTTTGKVSSVGGSSTSIRSSRTGTKKKDGSMRMSNNKVSRKGSSGNKHTGNVCRPKETVEQKKKDGSMKINNNKVSGKGRSGKENTGNVCRPKKTVERKKKDGLTKKIVKNVGVRVGTEAVLLAGTVGAVVASEFLFNGNEEQDEDKDKDEGEVEGEGEGEGEGEDEDEDGNEDEDEYENQEGNEDEDKNEYEDDEEDEYNDGDEDEDVDQDEDEDVDQDEDEDVDQDEDEDVDQDEDEDEDEDDYDDDY